MASGAAAFVASGLYPVAPHLAVATMRRLRGSPPRGRVARVIFEDWAMSMAVMAVRPLGFLGLPGFRRQARGPRPVILIHGFGQSRTNFLLLAHRLRVAGLGPLVGFEYWSLGKVQRAAEALGRLVAEIKAQTGAERVDLVGHSMGGIVGRYYVTALGGADDVEHLVTIGTPHSGTPAASFGLGAPRRELLWGSELIRQLAAAPLPPSVKVTAIWSRADGLVPSSKYARLPGAEEIVYDDLGHMALLGSRRVAAEIARRLAEPTAPRAPHPAPW